MRRSTHSLPTSSQLVQHVDTARRCANPFAVVGNVSYSTSYVFTSVAFVVVYSMIDAEMA